MAGERPPTGPTGDRPITNPESGIGLMEARAQTDLVDTAHANAIEDRKTTAEVAAFNDMAELEVFGSGTRTIEYTDETGTDRTFKYGTGDRTYHDPETGTVIATPDKPMKGKVDEILSNPRYGKKEADRKRHAISYVRELEQLMRPETEGGEGLEFCQAKMILDLRDKDLGNVDKATGGAGFAGATYEVKNLYYKNDVRRLKLIKEGGAFTLDEYERLRKGEDLYPGGGGGETVPTPPVSPFELPPEKAERIQKALENKGRLKALRERVTFGNKYKKELEAAEWEVRDAIADAEGDVLNVLRDGGASEDEIQELAADAALQHRLAEEQSYLKTHEEKSTPKRFKFMKRFYDFWARNTGSLLSKAGLKGAAKKSIAMGAIGFVPGVAVGAAGSVILGPIVGGALGAATARTVTRFLATSKLSKEAGAMQVAQRRSAGRLAAFKGRVDARKAADKMVTPADIAAGNAEEAENVVRGNRIRFALGAFTSAVGGLLGSLAGNWLHDRFDGSKGGPDTPDGPTPEEVDIWKRAVNATAEREGISKDEAAEMCVNYVDSVKDVGYDETNSQITELVDQVSNVPDYPNGLNYPVDAVAPRGADYVVTGVTGSRVSHMTGASEAVLLDYFGGQGTNDEQIKRLAQLLIDDRKNKGLSLLLQPDEQLTVTREQVEQSIA